MLKRCIAVFLLTASSALAAENPNAGQLFRFICFQTRDVRGQTPDEYMPGFALVVQLASADPYDASYFVKGNDNYRPQRDIKDFPVKTFMFENAPDYRTAGDIQTYTERLLREVPTVVEEEINFTRFKRENFAFGWGETYSNALLFDLRKRGETMLNIVEGAIVSDLMLPIFCIEPWAIGVS